MNREEIINYALTLNNVFIDYPFSDKKYVSSPVLKHKENNKWFGIFMKVNNDEYLNLKSEPDYSELLKKSYNYIIPAYHMNKEHWITIIINKNIDIDLLKELIINSYNLTLNK